MAFRRLFTLLLAHTLQEVTELLSPITTELSSLWVQAWTPVNSTDQTCLAALLNMTWIWVHLTADVSLLSTLLVHLVKTATVTIGIPMATTTAMQTKLVVTIARNTTLWRQTCSSHKQLCMLVMLLTGKVSMATVIVVVPVFKTLRTSLLTTTTVQVDNTKSIRSNLSTLNLILERMVISLVLLQLPYLRMETLFKCGVVVQTIQTWLTTSVMVWRLQLATGQLTIAGSGKPMLGLSLFWSWFELYKH